jgi:hypothetical protein
MLVSSLWLVMVLLAGLNTIPASGSETTIQRGTWSATPLLLPPGASGSSLSSVSCSSADDCFAVGSYYQGYLAVAAPGSLNEDPDQHPLIEHFNGKVWKKMTSPPATGALLGVDCISATRCFAVGGNSQAGQSATTLVEIFNGRSWAVMMSSNAAAPSLPAPAPYLPSAPVVANSLNAVSCTSSTNCLAVGSTSASVSGANWSATVPLSEHFDGSSWIVVPVTDDWQGVLVGVSCVGSQCTGVGTAVGLPNNTYPASGQFVGRYSSSSWQRIDAPGAAESDISGIDCEDSGGCTGVGSIQDISYAASLNNHGWRKLRTPLPPGARSQLNSVSCVGRVRCIAVGTVMAKQSQGIARRLYTPLIERQIGQSWQIARVKAPGPLYYLLASVSCSRAESCVAVGYAQQPSADDSGNAKALVVSSSAKK